MEVDFEKLVGKRILADIRPYSYTDISEYNVLEVSPNAKFVKLKNAINSIQCWKEINGINVVEILKTIKLK